MMACLPLLPSAATPVRSAGSARAFAASLLTISQKQRIRRAVVYLPVQRVLVFSGEAEGPSPRPFQLGFNAGRARSSLTPPASHPGGRAGLH